MNRWLVLSLVCLLLILPVRAQSDPIAASMMYLTLEQKVGQMFMVNLYGSQLTDAGRELLQTWQPGAVVLFDSNVGNPEQVTGLTNSFQQAIVDAGGIPLFIATDQEGGIIARLKVGFTVWPVPMLLTAADDPELAYRVGQAMARELRAVGVNMNLAPVADLMTNPDNPIIGRRSPGSDPEMVGRTLAAVVNGLQDGGVMATLKHFPGHGDTREDSHTSLPMLPHDRSRLDAVELPPFVAAMNSGAIMVSHIWFPEFEPDTPLPASLSPAVVTGLLRSDLAFSGIIITDAIDMDAIDTVYSAGGAAVQAILAGNDLIALGPGFGEGAAAAAMQTVVDAVRSGEITLARIDESVRRILEAKQRFNVLSWQPIDPAGVAERMETSANESLIAEVFRAGVALVVDEFAMVPLDDESNIAIIYPANRQLIRQSCGAYSQSIRWYAVSDQPSADEISTAAAISGQADTIVVFTRDAYYSTAQQSLVNALPPEQTMVIALVSPFDYMRFPDVSAYMVTYSPLDPGIETACQILFGEAVARGKLIVDLSSNSR